MGGLFDLRNRILRNDFYSFIVKVFNTVNPGTRFEANWHIKLIAEYLQAVEKGEIKRLVINLPPRSLKSLIVSVAWPAWLLGRDSSRRIIAASYSGNLSIRHSLDCRRVVTSDWYKKVFPKVELAKDHNVKGKFITNGRGYRIATSIDGAITGEGGNFLIIDDPHNPTHIHSKLKRDKVSEWFDKTFSTRLDDKKNGAFVLVMQRLHEKDLSGYLLKKGWEILSIPAIAEEDISINFRNFKYERREGELLHEAREGGDEIKNARADLGSNGFAAQYQQKPITAEGALIKPEWIKRYDLPPQEGVVYQSWDSAIKTGDANDFSVCTTWIAIGNKYFLLDVLKRKMEFPVLKREVVLNAEKFSANAVLIEDKSSGQSLIQELKIDSILPVIPVRPMLDKVNRLAKIMAIIEAGQVCFPKDAPWLAEFEEELYSFPNCIHDDQVDSMSQFLEWISSRYKNRINIRSI